MIKEMVKTTKQISHLDEGGHVLLIERGAREGEALEGAEAEDVAGGLDVDDLERDLSSNRIVMEASQMMGTPLRKPLGGPLYYYRPARSPSASSVPATSSGC